MKVVLLCGGQGTRIREASGTIPKPLLPIGGRPIVWHIMKMYARHGFKEFVLCLGHKGWLIKEYFLNHRAMTSDIMVRLGPKGGVEYLEEPDEVEWSVLLAETGELTQTGGRVAAVRKYLEADDLFMLTYGDGVSDIDIRDLVAFHRRHGRVATVTAVRPPGRFGEMCLDGDAVTEFNEKPQATSGFISGGFFVLDAKRFWSYLDPAPETILEREPMRRLAQDGELVAYRHDGFWQAMDTLREYNLLNEIWAAGRAPWK